MTWKKYARFQITHDIDLRGTGGPFIPKGTRGTVMVVRRGEGRGSVWADIDGFGHRHLLKADLAPLAEEKVQAKGGK